MSNRFKIVISVLAIIFSLAAAGIGFWFVGGTSLSFPLRFLCNFVFSMQFLATTWLVVAMFRKSNK